MPDDPIVVTGLGAVSPLGVGVTCNWQRLLAGQSGIGPNTRFDSAGFPCRIAGLVPDRATEPDGFDPLDYLDRKDLRKTDRFIHLAIAATDEALNQAGWHPTDPRDRTQTATIIATGVGGFPAITAAVRGLDEKGPGRLSPFIIPSFLPNLAAGHVSIRYGFTGPSGTPVTACAASAQSIGDGMRLIRAGEADVAVCGGAEACIDPVSVGGFAAARALSTGYNETPAKASRPFDKGHDGFVLSEGAATIVIEKLSHARRRGARPLAILAGYGTSSDGYHITAGRPDGACARVAMERALKMAGISPGAIDYVNAHSTSTPVGDSAELAALRTLFTTCGKALSVTSTKASTGHLLGAAGAIEAVFSVLALQDGIVPPALNLDDPMEEAKEFDLVPATPKRKDLRYVLSNGFGFGGVNASLIFERWAPC